VTRPRTYDRAFWLRSGLVLAAAAAVFFCQTNIDRFLERQAERELLYFPNARITKAAAFGYDNLYSDWIWLQTIQYYGRHVISDRQYRYLAHMFDVLTTLDPHFIVAYNFGALLLATDDNNIPAADKLLEKGMWNNPERWQPSFIRGFINYVFVRDFRQASRWFLVSARRPNAPDMAGRFAAFSLRKGKDMETSRALWVELYNRSNNSTERDLAQRYIAKIDRELAAGQLQKLAEEFQRRNKRPISSLHELVAGGLLKRIPEDPLGGRFYWDARAGKVLAR
jgi:hypothetical protein